MEIIFGFFALIVLGAIVVGSVMLLLFVARKMGFINADTAENIKGFKIPYLETISQSLVTRFALVALLSVLMSIPLSMVDDIVRERSRLYNSVLNNIASTWGKQQRLSGPSLLIPYTEKFITESILTDKDGNERKVNKTSYKQRTAIVLPESLRLLAESNGFKNPIAIILNTIKSNSLKINRPVHEDQSTNTIVLGKITSHDVGTK